MSDLKLGSLGISLHGSWKKRASSDTDVVEILPVARPICAVGVVQALPRPPGTRAPGCGSPGACTGGGSASAVLSGLAREAPHRGPWLQGELMASAEWSEGGADDERGRCGLRRDRKEIHPNRS